MDTRKRLYKVSQRIPTLSERVKKTQVQRKNTRNDNFLANRKLIDLDESFETPPRPAPVKLSQIKDKPARLRAYIEQKKTAQLKDKIEQRSPFIPYVPTGRWVEKKENTRKPRNFVITTPMRKALLSDGKILKKSTISELATTAKKENAGSLNVQTTSTKSRKKILQEFNNVHDEIIFIEKQVEDLNRTFEAISDDHIQNAQTVLSVPQKEEAGASVSQPTQEEKPASPLLINLSTPPEEIKINRVTDNKAKQKNLTKKESTKQNKSNHEKKMKTKSQPAKIVVPVKRLQREKFVEQKAASKPDEQQTKIESKLLKQLSKKTTSSSSSSVDSLESPKILYTPTVNKQLQKVSSHTYKFYKTSLDNQIAYLSMQVRDFTSNMDNFIEKLSDDTRSLIYQTLEQGKRLINEKFNNFEDVLNKFEHANLNDIKRITEDDVENYWTLLYEEIEKFKENFELCKGEKIRALKEKRRRTRAAVDSTPSRRSRRIAECSDTPKHNPSCFGCSPLSASKPNTPKSKSAQKRRTAFKKSMAFDES